MKLKREQPVTMSAYSASASMDISRLRMQDVITSLPPRTFSAAAERNRAVLERELNELGQVDRATLIQVLQLAEDLDLRRHGVLRTVLY